MIDTIDLSNYGFAFSETEINDLKQKNFIYGKNGTGKSSIVKAIREQCSEEFDLRVFDGWQGIIGENDRIDAISLGENNTEIQEKILEIETAIDGIDLELLKPIDNKENLYTKLQGAQTNLKTKIDQIEAFYTISARDITNTLSLGRSYNKLNFKNDIINAAVLADAEKVKAEETILAKKIDIKSKFIFPEISLSKYLAAVNELLQTSVTPSGVIKDLINNKKKQDFAKKGMSIHSRTDNEVCAFCGNTVDQKRWIELDSCFSDSLKELDERIIEGIKQLTTYLGNVDNISTIDESQFYPEYKDAIHDLNYSIIQKKERYRDFLSVLQSSLEDKKSKQSVAIDKLQTEVPEGFGEIINKYNKLYQNNFDYSSNLEIQQEKAKTSLRYSEVKSLLDNFEYTEEQSSLARLEAVRDTLQGEFNSALENKKTKQKARLELVKQSTTELTASININILLKGLGSRSFELEHIQDDGQNGQYIVKDGNGNERSIQTLSDGEKNIVAFLWFMNNIEDVQINGEEKTKIIIFDDPMTSNDDNCQYLMMGIIQKFYRAQNHPQMFLLTHNNHFYLQATPNSKKYPSQDRPNTNQRYIRLLKIDGKSEVKVISNDSENLKPIYEELWAELRYAYDHNKTIFMWNNMRRILETYNRFNYRRSSPADLEGRFDGLEDKALAIALIKSLNVNSHVGYETDIDISGKTKDELREILSDIFLKLGAEEHFSCYWLQS